MQETRGQPTNSTEANMWLIKFVEELPHRGSKRAEPRPSVCTSYQACHKSHSRSELEQNRFHLAWVWLSPI